MNETISNQTNIINSTSSSSSLIFTNTTTETERRRNCNSNIDCEICARINVCKWCSFGFNSITNRNTGVCSPIDFQCIELAKWQVKNVANCETDFETKATTMASHSTSTTKSNYLYIYLMYKYK